MSINVYFNKQYQKWHARIYHKRRFFHVGRYDTKKLAQKRATAAMAKMIEDDLGF